MGLAWIFKKLLWGNAFAAERGRIKLFGRMDWTLFPSRALALNLQTIGEKLGEDFVYKLGYQAGKDAAKEMVKYMGLKPRGGWVTQKAVIAMLEFIGFGKPEFIKVKDSSGRSSSYHRSRAGQSCHRARGEDVWRQLDGVQVVYGRICRPWRDGAGCQARQAQGKQMHKIGSPLL